ncbi:hypothetical protein ScPMuIL_016975 [Solemya velum]
MSGFTHAKASSVDKIPPMKTLLQAGVPSVGMLDTLIADLDSQLDDNTRVLDRCLQDLLRFSNELPIDRTFGNPKEALAHILSYHELEKDSCYDTDTDCILLILNHISEQLNKNPGSEQMVFQDLLSLSSEQGISLPLRAVGNNQLSSLTSVNAVSDNTEQEIAQQWNAIALHFRRYFIDRLRALPVGSRRYAVDIFEHKRLEYLQSLTTFFPSEDVWRRYCTLRQEQLEFCFNTLLPDTDIENVNFIDLTKNCREVSDLIVMMIDEDFIVLNSGVFKKAVNISKAISELYLEKFSDEMSALVEEIWDEVSDSVRQKPVHSHSQSNFMGSKLKLFSRSQNQSLENLSQEQSNPVMDNAEITVSHQYIVSLANIIESILHIEGHVQGLLRSMSWEQAGLSGKKGSKKGSLRGVLKPSSSPEANKRPLSMSESEEVFRSDSPGLHVSFSSTPSVMSDNQPAPKVVEKNRVEEKVRWDWKLVFKKISHDIARCIDQEMRNLLTSVLENESQDWGKAGKLVSTPVPEQLWGGKQDYPKCVSKAVFDFFKEVELLFPFAKAGLEGVLACTRTAILDSVNLAIKNFHTHFSKISMEPACKSPIQNLYVVLSSTVYIRNHLNHMETVLSPEEGGKKLFKTMYKQYTELCESIAKLISEIHSNTMATSILQDPDAFNWSDSKEFYEGERCAFPIQMWNYYLKGVQYDLWAMCPPRLAQSLYSTLLNDSLFVLCHRYGQAKPSFRRHPQIRYDITAILLCAVELLYPACPSVSRFLDVSQSHSPHYNIHNSCATLLSVMAIMSCPLDDLYRFYKKLHSQRGMIADKNCGSNTDWLAWIQPGLVQLGLKHYDDMQTTNALFLHLRLLLSQPEPHWPMIMQVLIMKDYTLPILFLTHSILKFGCSKPDRSQDSAVGKTTAVMDLFKAVLRTLCTCSNFPDAVTKVIIPVIDRCNDWAVFDMKTVFQGKEKVPLWMKALFHLLESFIHGLLKPVLEKILTDPSKSAAVSSIVSAIDELPCGCAPYPIPVTRKKKQDGHKGVVDGCVMMLLNQLADNIMSLPTPVCMLFRTIQEQCAAQDMMTPFNAAGLKILAVCIQQSLSDTDYIKEITGVAPNEGQLDQLTLIGNSAYHLLINGTSRGAGISNESGKLGKEQKEFVMKTINRVVEHVNNDVFEIPDASILERATAEFSNSLFTMLSSTVMDAAKGYHDLLLLYHLIVNNSEWLNQQLSIHLTLPCYKPSDSEFKLNISNSATPSFNPLVEFESIGKQKFDHESIIAFNFPWKDLIHSDLGLSKYGMRSLVLNRPEVQDGEVLKDSEKKPVAFLKSVLDVEAS